MFERFDIEDRDIFKVCVVATMSSGKSTFINSIIGEEIMPEKNEACTARTMAVLDNDNAVEKKAHIIRKNGTKELITITGRDVLDNVNNDEDVVDFLVEADIESIRNTSRALTLIDTPGVNNSEDERHGQRTEELLKQMDEGAVIYLMNATQLATNDDSLLLSLVADYVSKNENISIFFVINKIDMLDEETESIAKTVNDAKNYIESHGIMNPIIFPVSARSAKLLKMVYYKREMTRRERRSVEEIYENYRPERNSMLSYALTGEDTNEIYEIGDEEVTGQTLLRAIENTGIVAIENKIEELMLNSEERYNPKVVIKSSFDESVKAQYEKTVENFSKVNEEIAYQKFVDIENQVRTLRSFMGNGEQDFNRNTGRSSFTINGMSDDAAIPAYDFATLVTDVEKAKSRIDEIFLSDSICRIPYCTDEYFFPTKENRDKAKVKSLFLVSEDGREWKSIEFAELIAVLNSGNNLYLYNVITSLLMKVDVSDSGNLIALLDVRLPITSVRIKGFHVSSTCDFGQVTEYINKARDEYENQLEKIKENEERLKRTYKGIEFSTLEERDAIQKSDRDANEYCLQAEGKGYLELWNKKEELGKLPNAIFGDYIVQLMHYMAAAEAREIQGITEEIQRAELDSLDAIVAREEVKFYSQNGQQRVYAAADQRARECRIAVLTDLVSGAEDKTLDELETVKKSILALGYPDEIASEYVRHIDNLIDIREQQDIKNMCSGVPEATSVDELKLLISVITDRYREKFCQPYVAQIWQRVDYLHDRQLYEMCLNVENADREQLNDIRNLVDSLECKDGLKGSYRDRIGRRTLELDVEDLEKLTFNVESKGLDELEAIYSDLDSGRYNARYVEKYRKKVRGPLERAQIRHLNEIIENLGTMSRTELDTVKIEVMKPGYPDRVSNVVMQKIYNRQLELDMQQLIMISNDFDAMSAQDVKQIRFKINQMDVAEESKRCYENKLFEREGCIALYTIGPYVLYVKDVMSANPIAIKGWSLPICSNEYKKEITRFWKNFNIDDVYEMPIFMLQGDVYIVITLNNIYVKSGNGYIKYPLEEVHEFTTVKKFMFEGMGLRLSNGSIVNLSGIISKKDIYSLLQTVNAGLYCVKNPDVVRKYEPYYQNVMPLTTQDIEAIKHDVVNDELFWAKRMINAIKSSKNLLHSYSAYNFITDSKWSGNEQKLIKNMELPFDKSIVMYYDPTLFSTAKEGIAVGSENIYVKKANRPLLKLPVVDIVRIFIQPDESVIKVEMDDGTIYLIDSFDMNPEEKNLISQLLNEYVRDIMLLAPVGQVGSVQITSVMEQSEPDVLQTESEMSQVNPAASQVEYEMPQTTPDITATSQAESEMPQTESATRQVESNMPETGAGSVQLKRCIRCGKGIPYKVKYCMFCGTKQPVEEQPQQEVMFCANCGNKIMPGQKFCTICGKKQ